MINLRAAKEKAPGITLGPYLLSFLAGAIVLAYLLSI